MPSAKGMLERSTTMQVSASLTKRHLSLSKYTTPIKMKSKHTIPAQSIRFMHASIPVSNDHPIFGRIQPIPQFDERAKLIVAPTRTTGKVSRVAIKMATTREFP